MEKIKKFVRKYSFSPETGWQCYVQEVEGFVYATNGALIVRTKGYIYEKQLEELIRSEAEIPKVGGKKMKGYFEEPALGKPKIFDTEKLKKMLAKRKTEPVYQIITQECTECEGSGKVVWKYKDKEQEDRCPYCDGEGGKGKQSLKIRKYKYPPDKSIYFFKYFGISPKLLEKLLTLGEKIKIYKTNNVFLKGGVDEFEFVIATRK